MASASEDVKDGATITLLAGPTASGKSAIAMAMAAQTGALIVNADSQQLYADLQILTSRPTSEDEAVADHALYGIADAADTWSVGRWSRAVLDIMAARDGRPVILVGGTGLYFSALTRGLADIPAVPIDIRQSVEVDYDVSGETVFRKRLVTVDTASVARIEAGDRQRLVRAMSVWTATGRALSDWQAQTQPLLLEGSWQGQVIEPDRAILYARCDARVEAMFEQGVLNEVQALMSRNLSPILPAMKAVGLRDLTAFIRGDMNRDTALSAMKQATRNYAKRQLTWFRNQTPEWKRVEPPQR